MEIIIGPKTGYLAVEEEQTEQVLVNPDEKKENLRITAYQSNVIKQLIFRILNCLLFGLPWLVTQWFPALAAWTLTKTSLKNADYILVKDSSDVSSIHKVSVDALPKVDSPLPIFTAIGEKIRFFHHHHVKYVWKNSRCGFEALRGWDTGEKTVTELMEDSRGLTTTEESLLLQYYGANDLLGIGMKPLWEVLRSEVVNPFYLFQLFSIILWFCDEYEVYAGCVLVITLGSIVITLRTTRRQQQSLKDLVDRSRVEFVGVIRREDGQTEYVNPRYLVPGDVIEVPTTGCIMACDAVLLTGHCIVNESNLTGESSSMTKTPPTPTDDIFDSFLFKRNTLYCGTQVLQTRYYGDHKVTAVVINTGFCTAKGELIRGILHPKPLGFKFYEDSLRFVAALFLLAAIGIGYLIFIDVGRHVDLETIILDSLDLVTIVVPPALPAAMTSGIVYAHGRLRKFLIYSASPARINIAGKLKLFCFDKTGTLTEEGLDLDAVMRVNYKTKEIQTVEPKNLSSRDQLAVCMATCHSLTRISRKLCGDPLDLEIFNSINWELEEVGSDSTRYDLLCPTVLKPKMEPESEPVAASKGRKTSRVRSISLTAETVYQDDLPYEIGIVRQFPFSSASQGMSVITRCLGADHMVLYTKGAPEKIIELCLPDTVPAAVDEELKTLTSAGYRVLALACRQLEPKFNWRRAQKARRDDVERELTLLGLVVFRNNLRPNTTAVIKELCTASIRCVMVTGDNLLTAVSVSRDCGMVLPKELVVQILVEPPAYPGNEPVLHFEPMGVTSDQPLPKVPDGSWHYAMDGRNFALMRIHCPELVPGIIVRGTVFARMLPEQKTQLIEDLQDLNYIVGMCGDGANDCGALKAAHVGISLSETENSVAAPFTCTSRDLSCVAYLIKEGRCALVASFVIFKYMVMYSLIQFMTVLILYTRGISLGNYEFLYVDLIMTTSLAVVMGRTGPTSTLHSSSPLAKLFCASNLVPLILQIVLIGSVQLGVLYCLSLQPWYTPTKLSAEEVTTSWENTVIYCVSCFQYLILALIYSKGKPHCLPFYTDYWFMLTLVCLFAWTSLLTARPFEPLANWFELVPSENDSPPQSTFRVLLLLFPVWNLLGSVLIENGRLQRYWLKSLRHILKKKNRPKNRYKQILGEFHVWKPECHDSPC